MVKINFKADGSSAGLGIGVDIEKLARFRAHSLERSRFWENILAQEMRYLKKYKDPYPHAVGMFCAKEAIKKALSYFEKKVSFNDIRIKYGNDGRPLAYTPIIKNIRCQISITHTGEYALAIALCEKLRPQNYEARRSKRKN